MIALIINILLCGFAAMSIVASERYPEVFGVIVAVGVLMQIMGAIMLATRPSKAGMVVAIIGCALFVPLGLIGVYGARSAYAKAEARQLEQMRRQQSDDTRQ